jgi:hypothetical protein
MDEPLRFAFSITKSDYYQTLRAFYVHRMLGRGLIIIPLLITAIAFLVYIVYAVSFSVLFLFLLLVLIPGMPLFISPADAAEKLSKDERLSTETTWEVDENRIALKNKFSDMSTDWGPFGEVYETQEHYLLTYEHNKNVFQILPKRAFSSVEQALEFRKFAEVKTKGVQRIRSVNLPEFSKRTSRLILYGFLLVMIIWFTMTSFFRAGGR